MNQEANAADLEVLTARSAPKLRCLMQCWMEHEWEMATWLQAYARGLLARRQTAVLRQIRHRVLSSSASRLQAAVRRMLVSARCADNTSPSLLIGLPSDLLQLVFVHARLAAFDAASVSKMVLEQVLSAQQALGSGKTRVYKTLS